MTPLFCGQMRSPSTGKAVPGWPICQRIIMAMTPPTARKKRPIQRNCFAMTLWSFEMMYFATKVVGSGWMCCSAWKSGPGRA